MKHITRKHLRRALAATAAVLLMGAGLSGCTDADTVDHNITQDSENFKTPRKIIFINGITDKYFLTVEGYCNIKSDKADSQLEVICKVGDGYKKDFLGLSDNVTYMVEQLDPSNVSKDHYKIVLKPKTVVPGIEVR